MAHVTAPEGVCLLVDVYLGSFSWKVSEPYNHIRSFGKWSAAVVHHH